MKSILFLGLFLSTNIINGQGLPTSSLKFISKNSSIRQTTVSDNDWDYSTILKANQDAVLGFIGSSYQRFYIVFTSVEKDTQRVNVYYVKGKSRVKSNICDFSGEIKIINSYTSSSKENEEMYKQAVIHNDQEAMERFGKTKGFFLAEYKFYEDSTQSGSGVFIGAMKSSFYLEEGKVKFDDLDIQSDRYANNQYVGIWKSFKTSYEKVCNWGAYRIPNSGDLDVGTGEFSPNVKYLDNGWQNYYDAYIKRYPEALKEEEGQWW